jgi:hypothetical protein
VPGPPPDPGPGSVGLDPPSTLQKPYDGSTEHPFTARTREVAKKAQTDSERSMKDTSRREENEKRPRERLVPERCRRARGFMKLFFLI